MALGPHGDEVFANQAGRCALPRRSNVIHVHGWGVCMILSTSSHRDRIKKGGDEPSGIGLERSHKVSCL